MAGWKQCILCRYGCFCKAYWPVRREIIKREKYVFMDIRQVNIYVSQLNDCRTSIQANSGGSYGICQGNQTINKQFRLFLNREDISKNMRIIFKNYIVLHKKIECRVQYVR